jgi:plastocyanin
VASFHRDIADGELDNKGNEGKEIPGYLQNVQIGHKSYDLSTDKGKEAFAADIVDGKFDGKAKNKGGNWKGVDYDPETQTVTAGDRVYDLTNPKDFHDFQRDAADGKLGGEARKPLPHERLRG